MSRGRHQRAGAPRDEGLSLAYRLYAVGVASGSLLGFCSPWWWTGFGVLAAGLVWAAYDLVEVPDADASAAPR